MIITEEHKRILRAEICPYCKGKTTHESSSSVYGRDYGMIYVCHPCKAWVGVHKGTDKPLGRLANAELRAAKEEAHEWFDLLWKDKLMSRKRAYAWLSKQMGIPEECTHIGMMGVDSCRRVVEIVKRLTGGFKRLPVCARTKRQKGA